MNQALLLPKNADIDLLTRCVLMAETSRLNAANEFRKMIKSA